MLSLALAVLTAPGMVSNNQTGSLTSRKANGTYLVFLVMCMHLLADVHSYSNMDFALLSILVPSVNTAISRVLISYDIGCQWQKNLRTCTNSYTTFPSPLKLSDLDYWRVLIPKFHLPGHGPSCQVQFSLAYVKWAGWTDGEQIEGGWAQSSVRATLPYCSQHDVASSLARLAPLVTSGRLILDS